MPLNTDKSKPATVVGMVSQPNSARKPWNSARKPLVVRQTLTSKLRAERADQVAYYKAKLQELADQTVSKESFKSDDSCKKPLTSSVFKTPLPKTTAQLPRNRAKVNLTATFQTPSQKNPKTSATNVKKSAATIVEEKRQMPAWRNGQKENEKPRENMIASSARVKTTTLTSKHTNVIAKNPVKSAVFVRCKNFVSANIQTAARSRTDPTKKPVQYGSAVPKVVSKKLNLPVEKRKVTIVSPMRKSLTAMHLKRTTQQNRNSTIHRAQSLGRLAANQSAAFCGRPITVPESCEMVFKTPSLARRRSVCRVTPMSCKESVCSPPYPYPSAVGASSADLRRRLSLWLEQKGRPVGAYHHLRCFGLHTVAEPREDEENKENVEVQQVIQSSYTDLSIETGNVDALAVANDALFDLQRLIQEGYPRGQCEAWLDVISSRYPGVEHQPQYWECRAALEEARGDFTTAVDCYKRAIVTGAEVCVVDASLENLLQKFSVLNITPTKATMETASQRKGALDAKNVFKSSIINFAIQERAKTGQDDPLKFVATPVRRSTRASRTRYTSTPGVTVCGSLKKLQSPVRNALHFKANRALC